eukprot:TRINITY_DN29498_c0_g2_i10.p1 TRINITY_DN29498_c0_g2~~TRINITY_DN29498_c0_g2_i10.p1  ORF type:complete len:223 (+),score=29.82 TRINITY_DN29498_c0_g2_i10:28-669(+)
MGENVIGKSLSTSELEFFAESEIVEIVPAINSDEFTLDGQLHLLDVDGSFEQQTSTTVPLWLAMKMHSSKLCSIKPPYWMELQTLEGRTTAEKGSYECLEGLSMYFLEIGSMILAEAPEAFGGTLDKVKSAFLDLCATRMNKIKQQITDVVTSKENRVKSLSLNNLTHSELNTIREYFLGAVDMKNQIDKLERMGLESGLTYHSGRDTNSVLD